VLPRFLEGRDAQHREKRRIAIDDPSPLVGDVDALTQVAHEPAQRFSVVETGEPAWHGGGASYNDE
jgi:hypothetical protein